MSGGKRPLFLMVAGFALILAANTVNDLDSRRDREELHEDFRRHDSWAIHQRKETADRVAALELRVAALSAEVEALRGEAAQAGR